MSIYQLSLMSWAFSLLFSTSSLNALLPPLYETSKEIIAILQHPELSRLSSGSTILSVTAIEHGRYRILTSDQQMDIQLTYLPSMQPGPARFELEFGLPMKRHD